MLGVICSKHDSPGSVEELDFGYSIRVQVKQGKRDSLDKKICTGAELVEATHLILKNPYTVCGPKPTVSTRIHVALL